MAKRLALITGGMGGLGATITSKMVEAGYDVVVTASPQNVQAESSVAEMKARSCPSAPSRSMSPTTTLAPAASRRFGTNRGRSTFWSTTRASPGIIGSRK